MKLFECQQCASPIFFENTHCENCGLELGFLPDRQVLSALENRQSALVPLAAPQFPYRFCDNHQHGVCNWLVPEEAGQGLCVACVLNETIPDLSDFQHRLAWQTVETAKHRLIYSLIRFNLPFASKIAEPQTGLAFNFLADTNQNPDQPGILTGHDRGRITINIAEAESDQREATRIEMGEPYRTLIGHFRHEIGHYYWDRLIKPDAEKLAAVRAIFGDESGDYSAALETYYKNGPAPAWQDRFVSAYASAHPWEDWAETWSHYFHLVDTLETAQAFGIRLQPSLRSHPELSMQADFDPYAHADFDAIISASIPLALAVNSLNRSMGQPDLYPFVLPPAVLDKLRFIHQLVKQTMFIPHSTESPV